MSNTNKEELHALIERMPDDFTLEDLQYRLFVLQKLEKAEYQLKQGCKPSTLDERISKKMAWGEGSNNKRKYDLNKNILMKNGRNSIPPNRHRRY